MLSMRLSDLTGIRIKMLTPCTAKILQSKFHCCATPVLSEFELESLLSGNSETACKPHSY